MGSFLFGSQNFKLVNRGHSATLSLDILSQEKEFAIQDEYQEVEPQLDQQSALNKKIAIVSASTTSEFFFCPNLWTK